mmetsp:Transcript_9703/g.18505  ORF Transcript_9703/g.18505 Transcript_9703/m.18505 type:complete len:264 (+) Transcript_9703:400-1191(+)
MANLLQKILCSTGAVGIVGIRSGGIAKDCVKCGPRYRKLHRQLPAHNSPRQVGSGKHQRSSFRVRNDVELSCARHVTVAIAATAHDDHLVENAPQSICLLWCSLLLFSCACAKVLEQKGQVCQRPKSHKHNFGVRIVSLETNLFHCLHSCSAIKSTLWDFCVGVAQAVHSMVVCCIYFFALERPLRSWTDRKLSCSKTTRMSAFAHIDIYLRPAAVSKCRGEEFEVNIMLVVQLHGHAESDRIVDTCIGVNYHPFSIPHLEQN